MIRKIRTILYHSVIISVLTIFITGCFTIIGGAKYNAHIKAIGHPTATIYLNGVIVGTGSAIVKVKRNMADQIKITLKEVECEPYDYSFTTKAYRPFFIYTAIGDGIDLFIALFLQHTLYIPVSTITDAMSGACYKPDAERDLRIAKIDYDNYRYDLSYPGCKESEIVIDYFIDTSTVVPDKEIIAIDTIAEKKHELMILNSYLNKINVLVDTSINIVSDKLQISEEDKSMDDYYKRIAERLKDSGISDANYVKTYYPEGSIKEVGIKIPVLDEKSREKMIKVGAWHVFNEKGKISELQIYNTKGNKEGVWTFFINDRERTFETIYIDGVKIFENTFSY